MTTLIPVAIRRFSALVTISCALIATTQLASANGTSGNIPTFNSTTTSDLNDPTGWSIGQLPADGADVIIAGDGVIGLYATTIPAWSSITVAEGGTFRISARDVTLPRIILKGRSTLEVTGSATLTSDIEGILGENSELPNILIPANAVLTVPGGTIFKNCSVDLQGSVLANSQGKITFGYAVANETTRFAFRAEGATITRMASDAKDAYLEFACAEPTGRVIVERPIIIKDSSIADALYGGFSFGVNNPNDECFDIFVDNTTLEMSQHSYIAGGANVIITNNAVFKTRYQGYAHSGGNDRLFIQNCGRMTLVDGGMYCTAITSAINGNDENGGIILQPDVVGYIGVVIGEGGIGSWWVCNGRNQGSIEVANGTLEVWSSQWYSSREHAMRKLQAVNIPAGKQMFYKGINARVASNNDTSHMPLLDSPFSGEGDLVITNTRSSYWNANKLHVSLQRSDNTCTGRLIATEGTTSEQMSYIHLVDGAVWPGTIVLNGRADLASTCPLVPTTVQNKPTTAYVGGAELTGNLPIRLWVSEARGNFTVTNDVLNVGQGGWIVGDEGQIELLIQTAENLTYLPAGTEFTLGKMPRGGTIPKLAQLPYVKLHAFERPIAGSDNESLLMVAIDSSDDVTFMGTGGITNLNDGDGWGAHTVPTGQSVIILGAEAVINAEQPLPSFKNIMLKNGASLRIVGKSQDGTAFTLPPLLIDATSTLTVGDYQATETVATLDADFKTTALQDGALLSKLIIHTNATLNVQPGAILSNLAIEHYGTIQKATGTAGLKITIGYGTSTDINYLSYTGIGGSFDIHSAWDGKNGGVSFVEGHVKVMGDMLFKEVKFNATGSSDYQGWSFGNGNTAYPFHITFDNTQLRYTSSFKLAGASTMHLRNGSCIEKPHDCFGLYAESSTMNKGLIIISDTSYIDKQGWVTWNIDNDSAVGGIILDEGGYFCPAATYGYRYVAPLISSNGTAGVVMRAGEKWARSEFLTGFAKVEIPTGKHFTIQSLNLNNTTQTYRDPVRQVTIGAKPIISGGGDLIITNGVPEDGLQVNVSSSANTCTGTITVTDCEDPNAYTRLTFLSGANWAGLVRSTGYIAVSNKTSATTPSTIKLARLQLEKGPFRLNAFRNASTGQLTLDTLNITEDVVREGTDTGYLLFEGATFGLNDVATLGTAPANSMRGIPARDSARHSLQVMESEPNPQTGLVTVTLKRLLSTVIMIQ